ncbi:protein-(glutamine-N5) methyltransferase, release factor-specific, partial [Bifidobacterium longum]
MIADLIRQAAAQLREAGIETPEHDAKLLLAEAVDAELRDIDKA